MQTISHWARGATEKLAMVDISTARLDTEILLAHVMGVDRAWLIAHGDEELESLKVRKLESLLRRRLDHEPIAYIVGRKEFYGREFIVTPDVLIPRPATETMVEMIKKIHQITDENPHEKETPFHIVDVGCGSGCIGITAKLEVPELDVMLCDISESAIGIARQNADTLHAEVTVAQSDLLATLYGQRSTVWLIAANLPYVDRSWQTSPELTYEPSIALYADDRGLKLIKTLISQAPAVLAPDGYLLLETDPCQHIQVIEYGKRYGFSKVQVRDYIVALQKNSS